MRPVTVVPRRIAAGGSISRTRTWKVPVTGSARGAISRTLPAEPGTSRDDISVEASAAPLRVHATFALDWELRVRILKRRGPAFDGTLRLPSVPGGLASVLTPEPQLGVPDTGLGLAFPDPLNPPPGCPFHPRCGDAINTCRTAMPALVGGVACHVHSGVPHHA